MAVVQTYDVKEKPMLLDVATSAELLGMSYSWMKQQREILPVRIGRRKLFRRVDLEAFVEEKRRKPVQ
jgi:hypothetical protein